MRAAFAVLANIKVYNYVRKLAWQIHQQYQTGISVCRLPPHVSLKQPFVIEDLPGLEDYMGELASSITPFEVSLTELQLIPINIDGFETGLLWIDVQETKYLRQYHNRINQELEKRFGNTHADNDGAGYHFHMTVAMGRQPIEIYRRVYQEIPDHKVGFSYTVKNLALFSYTEPFSLGGDYMTYKILPIGGQ